MFVGIRFGIEQRLGRHDETGSADAALQGCFIEECLLERVKGDLELYGTVEQFPKMEGRQLVMVLAPIKKQEKKH